MRCLSLFSGIGGFDLAAEWAGMSIVAQVEIDPFCRAVLAKHWPGVPRHDDVRTFEIGPGEADVVIGGVPCQPASCAGKRKGASDDRWLWPEFVRVVRGARPRWFVAENPRGFLSLKDSRGVLGALEGAGYALWPILVGAHHVGAPHRRERVWIVGQLAHAGVSRADPHPAPVRARHDSAGEPVHGGCRWPSRPGEPQHEWEPARLVNSGSRRRTRADGWREQQPESGEGGGVVHRADGLPESPLGGLPDGAPRGLARWRRCSLKALGNAVVPLAAYPVLRAIMDTKGAA